MVPLLGVIFLEWTVSSVLILYWVETLIIGLLNVVKILTSKGFILGRLFTVVFFTFHFGMFCMGHGAFIVEIFDGGLEMTSLLLGGPLAIAGASFLVSHSVSLIFNYFGKFEAERLPANEQMFQPYGRIVLMHIVILAGGVLTQMLGTPLAALLLLIAIKTGIDLIAHTKEHTHNQQGLSTA